jgi:DNA (cytosine-5)-methyltransferase 1
MKKKIKVLDLFAGAGGFSEGFMRAGCDMVAHIEMNKDACDTIRTRMIYHDLRKTGKIKDYEKYLLGKTSIDELVIKYGLQKEYESVIQVKIDRNNYSDLIKEVKEKLGGSHLDIIIGGPPCQAYSHIGRGSDRKHMRRDPRKFLYEYYVEFLKALKPKVFVFENVPGLLSAGKGIYLRSMRKLMKEAGYETHYKILNAADYGVPQERRRVILMGWNEQSGLSSYPDFKKIKRNYIVKDFLKDLPSLKAGQGSYVGKYRKSSIFLRNLKIINPKVKVLTGHIARTQTKRDLEIYKIAVRKIKKNMILKYNELPDRLKTHRNQDGFLDRFKVVNWTASASHTVIAHISKDGNHYIHPDIKQNRSLTSREAARLQTFPDDFKFEGTRTSQFKQIGNAVPPILSQLIADVILFNLR